jgi:hypothetical protein
MGSDLYVTDIMNPITDSGLSDLLKHDIDILFIPGNASHPIGTFRSIPKGGSVMGDGINYETWMD